MSTKNKLQLRFNADKVSLNGPMVDGSYKVTFTVGEYQRQLVAPLVAIGEDNMVVIVEVEDESDS